MGWRGWRVSLLILLSFSQNKSSALITSFSDSKMSSSFESLLTNFSTNCPLPTLLVSIVCKF